MKRAHISLKTKLASALLQMLHDDGAGKLVPIIPYEDAKRMTADQIISVFHFDHGILHAIKPIDEPWNLTPRVIPGHRIKSRKDTGAVAKVKRITGEQEAFQRRLLARETGEPKQKSRWPSRKFAQAHR